MEKRTTTAVQQARDRKRGVRALIIEALEGAQRSLERAGEAPEEQRRALAWWGMERRFAGELERYRQAHADELAAGKVGPGAAEQANDHWFDGGRCWCGDTHSGPLTERWRPSPVQPPPQQRNTCAPDVNRAVVLTDPAHEGLGER